MGKLSLEGLRNLRKTAKNELRKREAAGKDIQVIVGMGTCGLKAGAKATLDVFINGLDEFNLADSVVVRQSGCQGFCDSEPTVEVIAPGLPRVIYGNVDPSLAKEIIQKHIIGRKLIDDRIVAHPAAHS